MTAIDLQCACGKSVSVEKFFADDHVDCPTCHRAIPLHAPDLFGKIADPVAQVTQIAPSPTTAKPSPVLSYNKHSSDPVVTPKAIELLRQIAHWTRIMAALMLLGAATMIALGIVLLILSEHSPSPLHNPATLIGLIYPCTGLISLIPAIYLLRFAANAGMFVHLRHENSLESALAAQKSYWKFVAVLALIFTVLSVALFTTLYLKTVL